MRYTTFGSTGIKVSKICIGCMDFPLKLAEKEAVRVIDSAKDKGVNFLDTSDSYGL